MTATTTTERQADAEPKAVGGLSARIAFNAVRRHPLYLAGIVLMALALAAGVWLFLPLPKKTAAFVIQVASQLQSPLPGATSNANDFAAYKQSQIGLIKRRLTLNNALNSPGVRNLPIIQKADPEPLTWLDKNVTVDSKTASEFIRVTIEGNDEEELLTLLRAIEKAYSAATNDRDNGLRNHRYEELRSRQSRIKEELSARHSHVKKIREAIGGAGGNSFNPDDKQQIDEYLRAVDAHAEVEMKFRPVEAKLTAEKLNRESIALASQRTATMAVAGTAWAVALPNGGVSPVERQTSLSLSEVLRQDSRMNELENRVEAARQKLNSVVDLVKSGAVTEHVIKAREELASAEESRDGYRSMVQVKVRTFETDRHLRNAEEQVARAQFEHDLLKIHLTKAAAKRDGLRAAINETNKHRIELETERRAIAILEKDDTDVNAELVRMDMEMKAPKRVSLAEEPFIVHGIEGSRRLKYTLVAALGVFLVGFGGLVMWEYRGRRFTHAEELSTQLGMRVIGTIPPLVPATGADAPTDTHSPMVEAIDTTRIMLTHGNPASSRLRVLLVTSAVSGEGKTTLSGNLAISLTRAGFRTLLIDGDMQAPSAHVLFDVSVSPGLSELLRGDTDLGHAIRSTPIPGLSVLPAGMWSMSTRQSLVGDRWRLLKRELESQFDFVVIDTSPLLMVSDAMLLAREADGVVLSVLLGVSQVARVAETVNRLHAIGAELAGVVVNNVQSEVYRRYMARSKFAAATTRVETAPTDERAAGDDVPTAEELAEEPVAAVTEVR
jgi:polysaccharide biosynthesis transport protein